ncbi:hypothetical protein BJX64DRAFT_282824 [Aspergillus heterothallicus]
MKFPYRYHPVKDHEAGGFKEPTSCQYKATSIILLSVLLSVPAIFAAGFVTGCRLKPTTVIPRGYPLATKSVDFEYNVDFANETSAATDERWKSLFPSRGGFFQHPAIAPSRSAFAVYHQLHCLDSIRRGYWALQQHQSTLLPVAKAKQNDSNNNESAGSTPWASPTAHPVHVRHCIELLRQALMCNADLTVEVKNESLGGVTGFGTEHQCLSWADLSEWISEWQEYGIKKNGLGHVHADADAHVH